MRRIALSIILALVAVPAMAGEHFSNLAGKYGFDAASDPAVVAQFKKPVAKNLAEHINVTGPIETVGGHFLVAHGCMPHVCTIAEGMLILDTESGAAIGFVTDNGAAEVKTLKTDSWTKVFGVELPPAAAGALTKWKGNLS